MSDTRRYMSPAEECDLRRCNVLHHRGSANGQVEVIYLDPRDAEAHDLYRKLQVETEGGPWAGRSIGEFIEELSAGRKFDADLTEPTSDDGTSKEA